MGKITLAILGFVFTANAGNSPTVIYGQDDRKDLYEVDSATARLADSTVAIVSTGELKSTNGGAVLLTIPFSETLALCPSEKFYSQQTAGFCSGFLVAEDRILTAGHCMSDDTACTDSKFIFGFAMHDPSQSQWEIPPENIYGCSKILHTVTDTVSHLDFALVQLDRPVTGHSPVEYRTSGAPAEGDPVMAMGHPMGLPLKIAGGAHIRSVNDVFFVSNLDTYGGNSGSAVFNVETGIVEGILVRGDYDFDEVNGCYTSHHCADEGCSGESATRMSEVLPYLVP